MGFRFQKRIKIAPGVRLNISKKGLSSVTVGRNGANVTVGRNGARANAGIPGTGLSYSTPITNRRTNTATTNYETNDEYSIPHKRVSILLAIGIMFMPYIFAWVTLKKGYSSNARVISFGWLALMVIVWVFGAK